jgi:3-hydroxyacyl-[acyl-carrier-protein] dehydratase
MPGVLILEAMAQVGAIAILIDRADAETKLLLFSGVERCRFRRPVVPGDQLRIEVVITNTKMNVSKCHAVATVDGAVCAEADLTSTMVNRP